MRGVHFTTLKIGFYAADDLIPSRQLWIIFRAKQNRRIFMALVIIWKPSEIGIQPPRPYIVVVHHVLQNQIWLIGKMIFDWLPTEKASLSRVKVNSVVSSSFHNKSRFFSIEFRRDVIRSKDLDVIRAKAYWEWRRCTWMWKLMDFLLFGKALFGANR